jgi:hypothetical protein
LENFGGMYFMGVSFPIPAYSVPILGLLCQLDNSVFKCDRLAPGVERQGGDLGREARGGDGAP